jgi:uncharacterized protein (TIGR04255 family)
MPFPETSRVLYKKNPLDRVICQLRFPSILRVDADIPAEFQDRIRAHFPNYAEKLEFAIDVASVMEAGASGDVLRQVVPSPSNKNYEFSSGDGTWQVNLTRSFVAFTAFRYRRWEEFREKLAVPMQALIQVYSPAHFSRIGLRYVNVVRRSVLGLDEVSWDELLQPPVLGIMGAPTVGRSVQSIRGACEIRLSDMESVVRLITGLAEVPGGGETCYVVDSDFSRSGNTDLDAAVTQLDNFHQRASRLIRWCITDRLHSAMEPQQL